MKSSAGAEFGTGHVLGMSGAANESVRRANDLGRSGLRVRSGATAPPIRGRGEGTPLRQSAGSKPDIANAVPPGCTRARLLRTERADTRRRRNHAEASRRCRVEVDHAHESPFAQDEAVRRGVVKADRLHRILRSAASEPDSRRELEPLPPADPLRRASREPRPTRSVRAVRGRPRSIRRRSRPRGSMRPPVS